MKLAKSILKKFTPFFSKQFILPTGANGHQPQVPLEQRLAPQ
jgi:hypothetical protein